MAGDAVNRRSRLPPLAIEPMKEVGLHFLSSVTTALVHRAPEQSVLVMEAASEMLSAMQPLKMFKGIIPRCRPEVPLTVSEGQVCVF